MLDVNKIDKKWIDSLDYKTLEKLGDWFVTSDYNLNQYIKKRIRYFKLKKINKL